MYYCCSVLRSHSCRTNGSYAKAGAVASVVYDVPYFSQFTTDFAIIFGERVKEATKLIYKHTKRSPPEECELFS
jgi:hypothetical protein